MFHFWLILSETIFFHLLLQPLVLRGRAGDEATPQNEPLTFAQGRPHVIQWAPGTVDNEFMGKKKSKCCCIYNKPRKWDDPSSSSSSSSSDSSDDEAGASGSHPKKCTEHCRGHTKHCFTKKAAAKQRHAHASSSTCQVEQQQPPPPPPQPSEPPS